MDWVFRTLSEKWKTECIAPKKKGKGVSVMVWSCFFGEKSRGFLSLCGEIGECKGVAYLKLLEYLILPVAQRANDTTGDAVFQQNNAPVHTASVVTGWPEQ